MVFAGVNGLKNEKNSQWLKNENRTIHNVINVEQFVLYIYNIFIVLYRRFFFKERLNPHPYHDVRYH